MSFTVQQAFDWLKYPLILQRKIRELYSESHRRYHNLDHLEGVLRWVPSDLPPSELTVVLEAIIFHDIVYLPTATPPGYNEALSIAEFLIWDLWYNPASAGTPELGSRLYETYVIEAINATAWHTIDQRNLRDTTKLVLDLDLQSFALPWEDYVRDADLVIDEFTPVYGRKLTLRGNKQFLEGLLRRNRLYYVKTEWEGPARSNILQRIDQLESLISEKE